MKLVHSKLSRPPRSSHKMARPLMIIPLQKQGRPNFSSGPQQEEQ